MSTLSLDPDLTITSTPFISYRPCVAAVVCNTLGQTLLARRAGNWDNAWQYPQGGIDAGETPRAACLRELLEETGIKPTDVSFLAHAQHWYAYDIPGKLNTAKHGNGQVQAWFLLQAHNAASLDLNALLAASCKEFTELRWVPPRVALDGIVSFKRDVYQSALDDFANDTMRTNDLWRW